MKKFLQKMIIPTVIMIWATWYYITVSGFKPLDSVLIRPIYIILAILYVINGITDYFECKKQAEAEDAQEKASASKMTVADSIKSFFKSPSSKIVLIFVQILLYSLLLKKIGFVIVNTVFLFGVLYAMGERKIWKLIVIPVVVTAAMYAVFVVGLKILLPKGILKGIL